jgi:hypothetical protein
MANADNDSHEFLPSEYDAAAQRFMSTGVKALIEAQGGIYSLVSKESMEQLPDYSLPLSDDDTLRGRPIEASSVATINYDDVITGDFDSVLASMDSIAVEMAGQITQGIMAHISEICQRTGNVVTGELSYDTIADVLEHMDFSFDESGNHNISIVVSPEGAERIRALGEPTAEQQARIDGIIARKRDEWNARRGSRSLPSRRV